VPLIQLGLGRCLRKASKPLPQSSPLVSWPKGKFGPGKLDFAGTTLIRAPGHRRGGHLAATRCKQTPAHSAFWNDRAAAAPERAARLHQLLLSPDRCWPSNLLLLLRCQVLEKSSTGLAWSPSSAIWARASERQLQPVLQAGASRRRHSSIGLRQQRA